MRAGDLFHINLDSESGTIWHSEFSVHDLQWLLCKPLAVLPDPMRIDRGDLARRCRGDMCVHCQRDVEVIVRMRPPGETPVTAKLRHAHRALHSPEVRIGKGNVDRIQLDCM